MIKRIAQTAGFTGLLAALLLTLLQSFWVSPLILQAETFEKSEPVAVHEHAAGTAAHTHDAEAWEPEDGWQRVVSTSGGNLVVAVGFALMLAGLYTLRAPTKTSQGLLWAWPVTRPSSSRRPSACRLNCRAPLPPIWRRGKRGGSAPPLPLQSAWPSSCSAVTG